MRNFQLLLCFSIFFIVLLAAFPEIAHARPPAPITFTYPITPDSTNFHGKEIQKVVDYLRGLNLTAYADNIELYLNQSKIIVQPLTLSSGELGQSDEFGGPIFIDPLPFNDPRWPMNIDNPNDASAAATLASILVHEKYHSEHHHAFGRAWGNSKHFFGGGNDFETEAWNASIIFMDEVINKTLTQAALTTNKTERLRLLEIATRLINSKTTLLADYAENGYGSDIWNATELEGIENDTKAALDAARISSESNSSTSDSSSTSLRSLIQRHDAFEATSQMKLGSYAAGLAANELHDSADFALKLVTVVSTVKHLPQSQPMRVSVNLFFDLNNSDFNAKSMFFLLNYPGNNGEIQVTDGRAQANYYLTIGQAKLVELYSSPNPSQSISSAFNRQEFILTDTDPIGRQFENTCGNGLLDRGEQCDYGYACPARLACSTTCACIYPNVNLSGADLLPPSTPQPGPNGPDENGIYYGGLSPVDQFVAILTQFFQPVLALFGLPGQSVAIRPVPPVLPNSQPLASQKTCSDFGAYSQANCNEACVPNQACKAYNPNAKQKCYKCANVCSPNEFFEDAHCAGTCTGNKECGVSREATGANGVCFVCRQKQRSESNASSQSNASTSASMSLSIPSFGVDVVQVSGNNLFLRGHVEGNVSEINSTSIRDSFNNSANSSVNGSVNNSVVNYQVTMSNGTFTFNHTLATGRHILTMAAQLVNGVQLSTLIFDDLVGTPSVNQSAASPAVTLTSSFELLDVTNDYARVSSLPFGHVVHFVVASNTIDVRQQLPITITVTAVNDLPVFTAIIANDPVANCRGADGCSIDGPLVSNDWQGKAIVVKATNKDGVQIAQYSQ